MASHVPLALENASSHCNTPLTVLGSLSDLLSPTDVHFVEDTQTDRTASVSRTTDEEMNLRHNQICKTGSRAAPVLDVCEPICQGERQLRDWISAGLICCWLRSPAISGAILPTLGCGAGSTCKLIRQVRSHLLTNLDFKPAFLLTLSRTCVAATQK